jgi:hypothetical protein
LPAIQVAVSILETPPVTALSRIIFSVKLVEIAQSIHIWFWICDVAFYMGVLVAGTGWVSRGFAITLEPTADTSKVHELFPVKRPMGSLC